MSRPSLFDLENRADFIRRHIGPSARQQTEMARVMGYDDLDALIDDTVPNAIRREGERRCGQILRPPRRGGAHYRSHALWG